MIVYDMSAARKPVRQQIALSCLCRGEMGLPVRTAGTWLQDDDAPASASHALGMRAVPALGAQQIVPVASADLVRNLDVGGNCASARKVGVGGPGRREVEG